jgi:hypothetical protein
MTLKDQGMARAIEVKIPLTTEKKDEILKTISDADAESEKLELALKAYAKEQKDLIDQQNAIAREALNSYRKGYFVKEVKATVAYDKNVATFYDVDTGEKVDERPMTEAEQLSLTSNRTVMDADEFVRRANAKEDENDKGEDE